MEILAFALALGLFTIYVVWRGVRVRSGRGKFRCWLVSANADDSSPLTADGPRGRPGTVHYSSTVLMWWGDLSLGLTPSAEWSRRSITVLSKVDATRSGQDNVRIRCRVAPDRLVDLELSRNAYNGLTSWLEATPTAVDWVI